VAPSSVAHPGLQLGRGINLTKIQTVIAYRQTQPPTLSGTGNEYQPKCGDALRLGNKGMYGSFNLWINVWMAGKIV